jgi:hypothetical protein
MKISMQSPPGAVTAGGEPDPSRAGSHRVIAGRADRRPAGMEATRVAGALAARFTD